jgi:hypothetical protein
MSGRLMKYATIGGRKVPIFIAEDVQHKGYKRLVDTIDKEILNAMVDRVQSVSEGDKMLTDAQKSATESITITCVKNLSWSMSCFY